MSFLCPSVGLLKFKRFTETGLANSRSRRLSSNVRNRGTSVSFQRAGSDVSVASQGGFSALYGEVNPNSQNETERRQKLTSDDSAADGGGYFAGIYIGEAAAKPQKSTRGVSSCPRASEAEYLAQDPAIAQSFTFFEETFISSQHNRTEMDEEEEGGAAAKEPHDTVMEGQQTPLLPNSAAVKLLPSPSSSSKKALYNLPNWVRQRRCLPTLNEVDFDKIDAISLGSLCISSDINNEENNNLVDKVRTQSKSTGPEVMVAKPSSVKRTHSDDSCVGVDDHDDQTQNPPYHQRQFLEDKMPQGGRAISVHSPKKSKRSESETTDDSVFEREPLLQQQGSSLNPSLKAKTSKISGLKKSPSKDSLRRRSKKREAALRLGSDSGKNLLKSSTNSHQIKTGKTTGSKDSENAHVGSLVRSKPLYMRATSERALDPSAMKMRLESSTARKWRQTGDRSPLGEVTNVSQPQPSMCLRMEIVQRPVSCGVKHPKKGTESPRKAANSEQGMVLPAGKIRPLPQWSKSASARRRNSLRRRSTEVHVKINSPRPANLTVKEANIDSLFRKSISQKEVQKSSIPEQLNQEKSCFQNCKFSVNPDAGKEQINKPSVASVVSCDYSHREIEEKTKQANNFSGIVKSVGEDTEVESECQKAQVQDPFQANQSGTQIVPGGCRRKINSVAEHFQQSGTAVEPSEQNGRKQHAVDVDKVIDTETGSADIGSKQPRPKDLVHEPKFADNSVKEARIVSTAKMAVNTTLEEGDSAAPLPPKMIKSASFAGSSQTGTGAKDGSNSAKSTGRSATNIRILQTPLTQQQRRKLRRSAPGNKNGRAHRVSAVEASRQDIVEVVAAMKASLDSTEPKGKGNASRRVTSFVKEVLADAVAMYDFEARSEDDVSIKTGDVVTVMNKDDPDWFFVKKHDGEQREGFVPRIFLQLKMTGEESPKSQNASKVHTRSVDKNLVNSAHRVVEQKTSLPLDTILEKVQSDDLNSHAPNSQPVASTIQAIQPVSADPETDQSASKASENTGATHVVLKTIDQSQLSLAETRGRCQHSPSHSQLGKSGDERRACDGARDFKFNTNIRGVASATLIETYVVLNDYNSQDDDEVSVVEGEVVVVNSGQQHEMDWMWVYVPRTERFGFVPAFNARPLGFHYSDV